MTPRISEARRVEQIEAALAAGHTAPHIAEAIGYGTTKNVARLLRAVERRDLLPHFTGQHDGDDPRIAAIEKGIADGVRPEIIVANIGLSHADAARKVLRRAGRDDLTGYFMRSKEQKTADMLEDVEFLCQFNTPIGEIVRRVGGDSASAVARMLFRAGRPELAQRFENEPAVAA